MVLQVGLSVANLANKWLDMLAGTAFTAPTTVYVQLHTAIPGAAGTNGASAETTRKALIWSAAANGSKAITTTLPSWASWTAGAETLSHLSMWDASTAGNFLYSVALTTSKAVSNGDTVNLTSHSISLTPIATT